MKLSNNLTLKEAIKSITAIKRGVDNSPNAEEIEKLKVTAEKVFQPVRDHFNIPIGVNSMFRSKALNKAIGGASGSQHMKGEAIDIDADRYGGKIEVSGEMVNFTNKMIFDFIKDNLDFDQLIWEYGTSDEPDWVHVSYNPVGNRKRVLKVIRGKDGRSHYSIY